ncbi:MAG: hypothetical protein HY329_06780 [Chloroflexi bacterium]|nr:hypothetical protein [Chloroflexota bacterium]
MANHAKFATAHLFEPQSPHGVFISMVSSHVSRGRRNLAANTITLMRHVGMRAFQTVLLPQVSPGEIKRLNHLSLDALRTEEINADLELERALAISEPLTQLGARRVHLASDLLDVLLNLRSWNHAMATNTGKASWGRRTITYFVFDPRTETFAPSKFCAYVAIPEPAQGIPLSGATAPRAEFTVEMYAELDATTKLLDGGRARLHLTKGLGLIPESGIEAPDIAARFRSWADGLRDQIRVHPDGPVFLSPPEWLK